MTKWGKLFTGAQKEILGASNGIGQKTFDRLVTSANQLGRKAGLEDIAAHAGLKKGSTQWLLDNYGNSAKSKTPLTLSNGHSPTEQLRINAQKAETARRGTAEAKIAQQNPGGLRINNSSLNEFDKAHGVSDAEMHKRRIETAAHKISGKSGHEGLEARGARTAEDRAANALKQRTAQVKDGVDNANSVEKSISRHARAQQSLANKIEDTRQTGHLGDGSSRLQQAEMREQQRQLKERLKQGAGSSANASSGFRKANAAWDAADQADSISYGGLGMSDEQLSAYEKADKKWKKAQKDNHKDNQKVETANEKFNREMEEEYQRGVADGSINPSAFSESKTSTPQSGGAETHTQSGGGSTGAKSGGEDPVGQESGGDTLLAKMQARAAKADNNADKYMFGTRLSNKIQEFEADIADAKDGNFKKVADKYGLNGTKEDKLRGQFEKQINAEAAQGHTIMDWAYGNDVPQKAVGGAAIAGAMSAIFGGGQKSNSDLYSNPFQ